MDTLSAIAKRRSVRRYKNVPLEWEKLSLVLDAGRLAPSAGNLQSWKFIVVQEQSRKNEIAEACLEEMWIAEAPAVIVICAEPEKQEHYYGIRGERLYSIQNCSAAAQNMLIAATALGLGSCWVGAFDENKVRDILAIPTEIRPQIIITIGYAAEQPEEPQKYPPETVVYFESWRGKIKDVPFVMGWYSIKMQQMMDKSKQMAMKAGKSMVEKAKEMIKK
ncbi:MAG: nitroreductase family protein [Candidatus Woesearchaeota archaeon]